MDEPRKSKPTIYDIAKASNAAPSTVSLVLNGRWANHRIKPDTAERILQVAEKVGYAVNLKARGLRLSRSGLAGMILPQYRNWFFAGLAEKFEAEARALGLCPIVVSTQRNPVNEAKVTEALLAQQIEFLFIAGVRDPAPLNAMCRAANVCCINIDLPGPDAPSVVSDNRAGARQLTEIIIDKLRAEKRPLDDWFFFGGVDNDANTSDRVAGFTEALEAAGIAVTADMFDCNGYTPEAGALALSERHAKFGQLPAGLFANGITALEGLLKFTANLPANTLDSTIVGGFDWDPFAAHLRFDLTMVRQDVDAMISAGFTLLDGYRANHNPLILIPTSIGNTI
ncbi:substrate-binding domain-containing protein [Devosia sp.]|uniref:substrate-binding domain-containing protein n=1 Tax=Devosia sp. TaxID=1871048 RepID=UPI0032633EC5